MEISLIFTGYGHVKLLTKVDDRNRFSITPAVQYEEKVTERNGFIAQELLNFQEIDCFVQEDDNFDPTPKIYLIYFPMAKYANNSFLRGDYEV